MKNTGVAHSSGATCLGGILLPFKAEVTVFATSTKDLLMAELVVVFITLRKGVPRRDSFSLGCVPTSMTSAHRRHCDPLYFPPCFDLALDELLPHMLFCLSWLWYWGVYLSHEFCGLIYQCTIMLLFLSPEDLLLLCSILHLSATTSLQSTQIFVCL